MEDRTDKLERQFVTNHLTYEAARNGDFGLRDVCLLAWDDTVVSFPDNPAAHGKKATVCQYLTPCSTFAHGSKCLNFRKLSV